MRNTIARTIIAAIEAAGETAPEWFLLFRAGWNEVEGEGRFLVDKEAFLIVAGHFGRRGNDIVVDYEHQTVDGVKAPAAGWINELRWEDGRGIMARCRWTDAAGGHIAKQEYRYFSPVFFVRKTDNRLVGLHSVALTNAPKTNHLTPILAKLNPHSTEEKTMDFLKKLIAKLGLSADAGEEDVLAAVAKLNDKPPEQVEVVAKEVLAALDMDSGEVSTVVASIHALKQAGKGMVSREEFDALQTQLAQGQAEKVVAKALEAGKITPDQRDWAMTYAGTDPDGFDTFVTKAPVVVPLSQLPGKKAEAAGAEADAAVLNVAKMMGVSAEDVKKYGGE